MFNFFKKAEPEKHYKCPECKGVDCLLLNIGAKPLKLCARCYLQFIKKNVPQLVEYKKKLIRGDYESQN